MSADDTRRSGAGFGQGSHIAQQLQPLGLSTRNQGGSHLRLRSRTQRPSRQERARHRTQAPSAVLPGDIVCEGCKGARQEELPRLAALNHEPTPCCHKPAGLIPVPVRRSSQTSHRVVPLLFVPSHHHHASLDHARHARVSAAQPVRERPMLRTGCPGQLSLRHPQYRPD